MSEDIEGRDKLKHAALAAVGYGSGINASDDESEWGDIQVGEDIITNKSYADYGSLIRKVRRLAC